MATPAIAALDLSAAAPASAPSGAPPSGAPAGESTVRFWDSWLPANEAKPEIKEAREWISNKNYADPLTLVRSAHQFERDAATLRAGRGYPTAATNPDGTPAKIDENAWKAWTTAVGVPETADKYDIPVSNDNPYPQYKSEMAQAFHRLGVPAAMATGLARANEEIISKLETQIKADEDAKSELSLKELEREWGPNYQERVALAARGKSWLAQEVGGIDDRQMRVLENVLGTSKFLSAMWKMGAGNREAQMAGSSSSSGFGAGSAADAQAKMDQLTASRMKPGTVEYGWSTSKFLEATQELEKTIINGMAH